jgi:membrane associated rhomboid family serine protease
VAQVFLNPFSRVPMVGASGAIAGVMGAYLMKFPRAQIRTLVMLIFFFWVTEVPAWAMLIYWFVIQLFSGVGSLSAEQYSQGGGTAFFAHVGGFIAGIVLIRMLGTRTPYYRRRDLTW